MVTQKQPYHVDELSLSADSKADDNVRGVKRGLNAELALKVMGIYSLRTA